MNLSKNFMKMLLKKSNIILRLNTNKIITYANEEFYKISGFTKEELVGKNYYYIKNVSSNDDSYILKNVGRVIKWKYLERTNK